MADRLMSPGELRKAPLRDPPQTRADAHRNACSNTHEQRARTSVRAAKPLPRLRGMASLVESHDHANLKKRRHHSENETEQPRKHHATKARVMHVQLRRDIRASRIILTFPYAVLFATPNKLS